MRKILLTMIMGIFFYFPLSDACAEIIFQDDFESDPSDWTCSDGQLSKWSATYMGCGTTSGFGPEWKMGPGHNSNNAVHAWKKTGVPNGYRSESDRWLTGSDIKTEIYHRWYMKVPTSDVFNKAIVQGYKFWRYITRENGYTTPPEIYLNVQGSTFASGNMGIWLLSSYFYELCDISEFNDNDWHCHEMRIKVNTSGKSDGVIQYWLDGVLKATHSNLVIDNRTGQGAIHRFGIGIGNVSDSDWYQAEWSAIAFDDVVVSTEYVGPNSGPTDTVPPAIPTGIQTQL